MEPSQNVLVFAFLNFFLCWTYSQELNFKGRNVCEAGSNRLQCCSGWAQQGDECLIPMCEGNFTCKGNEVCVRPNECRCRHGYFGATCDTKCPSQFWGPDCKGKCECHPNGECNDVTGACTCKHNRWGTSCERACGCQKGRCNQETGACTCDVGFWGALCYNKCTCSVSSVCNVSTGQCHCTAGWYGKNCKVQCQCRSSPCEQHTGTCKCRERTWGTRCEHTCQCFHGRCNANGSCTCWPGYRGKLCREPCPAGFYGQNCRNRCGYCKGLQPCKVAEGHCIACESGWNGTRCDEMCAPGFFGENCKNKCSPCKDGHFCNRIDGKCPHCNPGWMGDWCEVKCPNGTYGENCTNECNSCFNGMCHFATGECLCDPGYSGVYCNESCSAGQYGVNCAKTCLCHDNICNPMTGACHLRPNQRMGVLAAGLLVTCLFLLLLSLVYCCIRRQNQHNHPDRKSKRRISGQFTRISSKLPRIPLRRQKLPKVVVSHHDPDNTFNCSFIEPPSAVALTTPSGSSRASFSSIETPEDEHVYEVQDTWSRRQRKGDTINTTVTTLLADDDVFKADTLLEDWDMAELASVATSELPYQKSSESAGSCSGTEPGAKTLHLRASAYQPAHQYRTEPENSGGSNSIRDNGKPTAAERVKPRPPDPSTKPKLSWIHTSPGQNQNQISQEETIPHENTSSRKKSYKKQAPSAPESAVSNGVSSLEKKTTKGGPGLLQMEHINGAVQSVLRKMGLVDRKTTISKDSLGEGQREVNQSNLHSEVASLLASQLKDKTQSVNRSESGSYEESLLHIQPQRKKPTPPQKTLGSQPGKALLPTSTKSQKCLPDIPLKEAKHTEKQDSNRCESISDKETTVKVTPMKKPPRKMRLDDVDSKTKTTPKIAVMPPKAAD